MTSKQRKARPSRPSDETARKLGKIIGWDIGCNPWEYTFIVAISCLGTGTYLRKEIIKAFFNLLETDEVKKFLNPADQRQIKKHLDVYGNPAGAGNNLKFLVDHHYIFRETPKGGYTINTELCDQTMLKVKLIREALKTKARKDVLMKTERGEK